MKIKQFDMNKNKFCEDLYQTFPDKIVPKRDSLLMPLCTTVVGCAVLLWSKTFVADDTEFMRYASLLIGVSMLLGGLIFLVVRLCNKRGLPYYARTNKPLKYSVLSFSKEQAKRVTDLVNKGDVKALRSLPANSVSSVAVMVFAADNDEFVAMQAFTYAELDYHPITDKVYVS